MNRLKGIIGFAVAFIVVCVVIYMYTGSDKLAPFKEFRSDEGRFIVLMPGKPEVRNEAMDMQFGTVNTITYMAGSRKIGCAVSYTDYPALLIKSTDPQKLLKLAKDGAVKKTGGWLISETNIDFHGLPAKSFLLKFPAGPSPLPGISSKPRVSISLCFLPRQIKATSRTSLNFSIHSKSTA